MINALIIDFEDQGVYQELWGGAEGTRTPDPHTASVVRYQLRHGPARLPRQALARYYTPPGRGTHRHSRPTPRRLRSQLSVGSVGKRATAAYIPPGRRSTIDHMSSGRSVNGSLGRALKVNHDPVEISSSS